MTPDACEYCDRGDVVLYAWHADVWCAVCIRAESRLLRSGGLEDAPLGRPDHPTYEQPYVWQTPDGSVIRGVHHAT